MESKWLEDFLTLAETRSFSRAAQLRGVSQPAFSRRIQALEGWVGSDLIDRTSYPTRLTAAGGVFHEQAIEMLGQINGVRALLRGKHSAGENTVAFAVPHTLAITFFPQWLTQVEQGYGALSTRLSAFNVHDALLQLVDGACDMVMIYNHPKVPIHLDAQRYDTLSLGTESLQPYAQAVYGKPLFTLPGKKNQPVPFLSYTHAAYLGRMTDALLAQSPVTLFLDTVFETDMAEVIKNMALAGHGVAFLPASAVRGELANGRLAVAGKLSLEMEIRLIRERPQNGSGRPSALKLWDYLAANAA